MSKQKKKIHKRFQDRDSRKRTKRKKYIRGCKGK